MWKPLLTDDTASDVASLVSDKQEFWEIRLCVNAYKKNLIQLVCVCFDFVFLYIIFCFVIVRLGAHVIALDDPLKRWLVNERFEVHNATGKHGTKGVFCSLACVALVERCAHELLLFLL